MSETDKKKNKNFNFIIITIIFFLGLSVFQFFMYRNMRPRFHVVSRVIDFNIYEDLSVDFSTKVDIQVERERILVHWCQVLALRMKKINDVSGDSG